MSYFCYIVECADGSFYTGWTIDPARREKQHNRGVGAAYTKLHRPVHLVYIEELPDRSTAMKRERAIKTLNHAQKAKLVMKNGEIYHERGNQ
jgi:putative endonuclease